MEIEQLKIGAGVPYAKPTCIRSKLPAFGAAMFARNEELLLYLHECRGMRLGDVKFAGSLRLLVGEGASARAHAEEIGNC